MTSVIVLVHSTAMLTAAVLAMICLVSAVRVHCAGRSRANRKPSATAGSVRPIPAVRKSFGVETASR